jgi:exodeoxyribonuclease VII small subunit
VSDGKSDAESPSFEDALARLEGIVTRLEKGELSLEESLELYEQGIGLSRLCHGKLTEAEDRIELLLKNPRGDVATERDGSPRTRRLEPSAAPEPKRGRS